MPDEQGCSISVQGWDDEVWPVEDGDKCGSQGDEYREEKSHEAALYRTRTERKEWRCLLYYTADIVITSSAIITKQMRSWIRRTTPRNRARLSQQTIATSSDKDKDIIQ